MENLRFKSYEYKNLRKQYSNYEEFHFLDIWELHKKFKRHNKIFKLASKIENINMPYIDIFLIRFFCKLFDFLRWKFYDFLILLIQGYQFNLFGVTCYCGKQGSGKTIGVVREVEKLKEQFPKAIVCTNIDYINQDVRLTSWLQLLELRNGKDGVIFVIDEVQNQGLDWTKFPDSLMRVITQQRKQNIKIFLTAQVYKTVVIQLRRQCFDVVECKTFFGRWTRYKCYDAEEYNNVIDNPTPEKKIKLPKKYRDSFIQSNYIRALYDTSQVVYGLSDFDKLCSDERMTKYMVNNKKLKYLFVRINGKIKRYGYSKPTDFKEDFVL